MSAHGFPIFSAIRTKLAWLSARQKVVSENIANANTPGFRARELKPVDFRKMLENQGQMVGLRVTNAQHMSGQGGASRLFDFKTREAPIVEMDGSGNSVSIAEETMKLGRTQVEYEMTTNIYRKQTGLLRIALGRRQ